MTIHIEPLNDEKLRSEIATIRNYIGKRTVSPHTIEKLKSSDVDVFIYIDSSRMNEIHANLKIKYPQDWYIHLSETNDEIKKCQQKMVWAYKDERDSYKHTDKLA